jgi:hypothetical protein
MVRKSLVAVTLALLAFGAGRPAAADQKFLEPYGEIFGARTLLGSPNDLRPRDAIQGQEEVGGRASAFIVNPFWRVQGFPGGGRATTLGGSLAYAGQVGANNPFQLWSNLYAFNPHGPVSTRFGFDVGGKLVLWQPANVNLPVVSGFAQYRNIDLFGFNRIDAGIALDQRITDNIYLTGNVGFGYSDFDFTPSTTDVVAGVGLTWRVSPRISFSGDYVISNDVDGEDRWSIAGIYAVNQDLAVRLGGGKRDTFFANATYKFGRLFGTAAR